MPALERLIEFRGLFHKRALWVPRAAALRERIVRAALGCGGEKRNGHYGEKQNLLYHELLSLLSER